MPRSLLVVATVLSITTFVLALLFFTGFKLTLDAYALYTASVTNCAPPINLSKCTIRLAMSHNELFRGLVLGGSILLNLSHAVAILNYTYYAGYRDYGIIESGYMEFLGGEVLMVDGAHRKVIVYTPISDYGDCVKHIYDVVLSGISIPLTLHTMSYSPLTRLECGISVRGTTPLLLTARRHVDILFVESLIRELARLVQLVRPIELRFPHEELVFHEIVVDVNVTGRIGNETVSKTVTVSHTEAYCRTKLCYFLVRSTEWLVPALMANTNRTGEALLIREVDDLLRTYAYLVGLFVDKTNLTRVKLVLSRLALTGVYWPSLSRSIYYAYERYDDQEALIRIVFETPFGLVKLPLLIPVPVKVALALHMAEENYGSFKPGVTLLDINVSRWSKPIDDLVNRTFTSPVDVVNAIAQYANATASSLWDNVEDAFERLLYSKYDGLGFDEVYNLTIIDAWERYVVYHGRQSIVLSRLFDVENYILFYICKDEPVCTVNVTVHVQW